MPVNENRTCERCGVEFSFRVSPSRIGRGKYCSKRCSASATGVIHGHASTGHPTRTYSSYRAMLSRCYYDKNQRFKDYGAKGITVCDRWLECFENFLSDMGEAPEGKTLDRKDGTKGYSPDNCKWSTRLEQQSNTKSNVWIEMNGKTKTLSQWGREFGISHGVIKYRLNNGWDLSKAITFKPWGRP